MKRLLTMLPSSGNSLGDTVSDKQGQFGYMEGSPWHVRRMHPALRFSLNASWPILSLLYVSKPVIHSRTYSILLEWEIQVIFFTAWGSSKSISPTYHPQTEFVSFWVTFVHVPRIWVKPNPSKTPKMHHAALSILTRPHTEPPLPLLHTEVHGRQRNTKEVQVSRQKVCIW